MSVLSVYIGLNHISCLGVTEDGKTTSLTLPYSYLGKLNGINTSASSFYEEAFAYIAKELGYKLETTELLITGYPTVPNINHPNVAVAPLMRVLAVGDQSYFPIVVDTTGVYTPTDCICVSRMDVDLSDNNYNLIAYPGLRTQDPLKRVEVLIGARLSGQDLGITEILKDQINAFLPTTNVIGSGSITSTPNNFNHLSQRPKVLITGALIDKSSYDLSQLYLLAIDLVSCSGIYELYMDFENAYVPLMQIKLLKPELFSKIEDLKIEALGTLVNSKSSIECLIETELGTKQFLELPVDSLSVTPLASTSKARINIRGKGFDDFNGNIYGGSVGLMLDTRIKGDVAIYNHDYIFDKIKTWEKTITESLAGF